MQDVSTRQRRGRTWRIIAGLLIASLATGLWLAWPRERNLVERSRPVAALDRTLLPGGVEHDRVEWLSVGKLLIVTTDTSPTLTSAWQGHADLITLPSHNRTRLAGLTHLLNTLGVTSTSMPYGFSLSPDGRRLHWRSWRQAYRTSERAVASIAGWESDVHRDYDDPEDNDNGFWIDARRFAEIYYDPDRNVSRVRILDADDPKNDRAYPRAAAAAQAILTQFPQFQPTETLAAGQEHGQIAIDVAHYDHGVRETGTSGYFVPLPKGAKLIRSEPSPQRTAIVYQLRLQHPPPRLIAWLSQFRVFPVTPMDTEALWISRADGTGLREIGHMPGAKQDSLEAIQWLPDGRQISFIYRGMLYTLPAEPAK